MDSLLHPSDISGIPELHHEYRGATSSLHDVHRDRHRSLGSNDQDFQSLLVDKDGNEYDPYSLAWRYLGLYIGAFNSLFNYVCCAIFVYGTESLNVILGLFKIALMMMMKEMKRIKTVTIAVMTMENVVVSSFGRPTLILATRGTQSKSTNSTTSRRAIGMTRLVW